jgi:[acyl-carrier-protein] S-malonyltransferase
LCAYQLAAWRALRGALPAPSLFASYSVGELAAYGCADALSPSALIDLARRRAADMDAADRRPAGLLAVRGLTLAQLEQFGAEIAIVNGHDRLVVGGLRTELDRLTPLLLQAGAKLTGLQIAIASHTGLMAAAVARFRQDLQDSPLCDPSAPVLAGIDASPARQRGQAIDFLSRQLAQRLNWAACQDAIAERGCRVVLELGPGDGLTRMLRDRQPSLAARSLAEFHSLEGAAQWVARALL